MAKRTSLSGKLEGHSLYVTSRADPLLHFVSEFHRKYIVPTFDARESEAVELWIDRLNDQVAEGPLEASPETVVVTSTAAGEGAKIKKPVDGGGSHHEMVAHRDAATTGGPTAATLSCSAVDYEFIVAVIVRDVDNEVLGGASHEIYLQAQCALISFLVVDPALRGMGAAGALISCVQTNATVLLQQVYAPTPASLRALFIEVLQVRDDHSSDDEDEQPEKEDKEKEDAGTGHQKKDSVHSRHTEDHHVKHLHHLHVASGKEHGPHPVVAPPSLPVAGSASPKQTSEASTPSVVGPRFRSAQRQVIFRRLGFTALDYDLLHPGSMRGHRYNLGVLRTQCVSSSGKEEKEGDGTGQVASDSGAAPRSSGSEENLRFPVPVLLAFLEGLILGILRDEGATDLSQWEEDYVRFLTGKEWVGAGDQFWC